MAQHSSLLLLSLAVIAAFSGASRPHIIGGSVNTDNYLVNTVNRIQLKSLISNFVSSRSGASVQEDTSNDIVSLTYRDLGSSTEAEYNLSALSSSIDNQLVRVPPAAFSGTDQVNPFTRMKGQECYLTPRLTKTLSQEISRLSLNNTMFLGYTEPRIPANQTSVCLGSMNASSTSTEKNLRTNCPWKLLQRDFGVNSYPRYADDAVCLCTQCLGTSPMFRCRETMASVTYFQLLSCQDEVPQIVRRTAKVAVGCFCASPTPDPETENADFNEE